MTAASLRKVKKLRNEQEQFWSDTYAQDYIAKNSAFDRVKGVEGWTKMLAKAERPIDSVLECGCNIGRNIDFLGEVLPEAQRSIIEVSKPAYAFVTDRFAFDRSYNGTILESDFAPASFDLAFTIGVLIHIHPDNLLANMRKMFDYSRRYVLIGEYFNRTPVMLEYQGEQDRLFKCDFGKLFLENHAVDLIDYGFLWGYEYDAAGFDDITWWLFEKR
jgi:pseudaminic acid biosynthesis-associated methylase